MQNSQSSGRGKIRILRRHVGRRHLVIGKLFRSVKIELSSFRFYLVLKAFVFYYNSVEYNFFIITMKLLLGLAELKSDFVTFSLSLLVHSSLLFLFSSLLFSSLLFSSFPLSFGSKTNKREETDD